MQTIEKESELLNVVDNLIIGNISQLKNSKIVFYGKNNILFCEDSIILSDSLIEFGADNSIIFLRKSSHDYKLSIRIFNNSAVYIDSDNYFNEPLNAIVSEGSNLVVGKDCMFSTGISIMTADHHLIYDIDSLERLNSSKSIYIGDHVWIGQNSTILKGTKIDSGSIIGALSLVPGITIENNSIYAGNPAKMIKNNIFWNGACVHKWKEEETKKSEKYDKFIEKKEELNIDDFIYNYDDSISLDYDDIDKYLKGYNIYEKYDFLLDLAKDMAKNKFVHQLKDKNKEKQKIYPNIH